LRFDKSEKLFTFAFIIPSNASEMGTTQDTEQVRVAATLFTFTGKVLGRSSPAILRDFVFSLCPPRQMLV
jgi:hypothetical protein